MQIRWVELINSHPQMVLIRQQEKKEFSHQEKMRQYENSIDLFVTKLRKKAGKGKNSVILTFIWAGWPLAIIGQ